MHAMTRTPRWAPWRAVCAATLAFGLVACGGGGADTPATVGTTGPQSFATGPITGLGSVIVNGIRFDDSSARVESDDDGSLRTARELKLGMMVEVQAGAIDDSAGRAVAGVIRFGSELVGAVTALDAAASTLRMLDQTVEVKATTVFEEGLAGFGALALGQVLEIHAQFDGASGRYIATRIEREDNANVYRLRGRIAGLDAAAKTFRIGDAVINYAGVPVADLPSLADGQRVRVRLQTAKVGNQWVAVSVRSGVRRVDDVGDARLRGLITAFTSAQQFEVQGIAIDASGARIEPNAAALVLGALVEVRGTASAGRVVASRVSVRNERDDDLRRVELHGSASALDTAAKTFMLREIKVDYSQVLEWKDGAAAELANGRQLEVKGVWSADRTTLIAAVIEFEG